MNIKAHWLITTRVIGYEDAPLDTVHIPHAYDLDDADAQKELLNDQGKKVQFTESVRQRIEHDRIEYDRAIVKWLPLSINLTHTNRTNKIERVYLARRLHLAPFDDKRQDDFTHRWFRHWHNIDYSLELMREVRAHNHNGVRIISRVPNLLCMMNILKRSGKPLPDGRAALYDAIVQAYLGGIDAAYRLRPILGHTCPFDTSQRRFLLSFLGAHMQHIRVSGNREAEAEAKMKDGKSENQPNEKSEGNILISRPELGHILSPAIKRMREECQLNNNHTTTELLDELLHHIASRSGLLIPRSINAAGDTLYGFTHLSFLEFFAAEWLGLEFDRQRNRNARRTEAADDNQLLTELDLDREFPPNGPIQHSRECFKVLPSHPVWHEPLIFLLESRKLDTHTLLRWFFPALYNRNCDAVLKVHGRPTPLLALEACQLAINLTQNPEIILPTATRQAWWQNLWTAYFMWPYPPWINDKTKHWPVAQLLLGGALLRSDALKALVEAYNQKWKRCASSNPPQLCLDNCTQLTSADISHIGELKTLKSLSLTGCTGLTDTHSLAALTCLNDLYLTGCTGLHGRKALQGLVDLPVLKSLYLSRCTGLTKEDVQWLRKKWGKQCIIFGP